MPATLEIDGVRFTNPDRVLFPEQGITKQELADYYRAVASWILPLLRGRPLTLVRCPRGREKECFVQRRAGEGIPEEVRRVEIPDEDEEGGIATHLAVESLQGLLGLVQIGVLELHTWGARRDRLDRPDRMVIDLDPDPSLPFARVTRAAVRVREKLEEVGLAAFVMTTGGKGLHVVSPIRRGVGWDELKAAARALAEGLEAEDPGRFVSRAAKKEREGRIYVDYLRNGWGATSISPYSTRARRGAPVATPVRWEELADGVDPGSFDLTTVPARLQGLREDPWTDFRASARSLSRVVREGLGAG